MERWLELEKQRSLESPQPRGSRDIFDCRILGKSELFRRQSIESEETLTVLLPFRDDGGWSIDGAMPSAGAKLESNGVHSILVIDKGRSELVLRHRTPRLRVGATISLVFWSLLLAIGLISRQQWALRTASR